MKGLVHKTRVAEAVIFSQKRENEQKKETKLSTPLPFQI